MKLPLEPIFVASSSGIGRYTHPQPHHHHHHNNNRRRLSLCGREHSCGQSPALLDPIRCATMHRNGSGTSVKRYPQPTDLIWMPAGSLRQLSVHQVQPAGVVFRDSDGPKAFRIRRTGPAAPGKGGGRSRTSQPLSPTHGSTHRV